MPSFAALTRHSPTEWAVRIALAMMVAVLGYYGVTFSIAQVIGNSDPVVAHRLAAHDGRITANLAASLSGEEATAADRHQSDFLAKLALLQDPTAVLAVSTLGINAEVRGDVVTARKLFTYAQKLSRRDLRTQVWMIEDAVRRNDIPGALRQYDITLRVFPALGDTLYSVLAAAISEPAISGELIKTLAGKPLWSESFLDYAAKKGDPRATARLFVGLSRNGVTVSETARADVLNTLLAAGQTDAAWAYYASIRTAPDRRRSRDPRFTLTTEVPPQFDWITINDGGLTTSIQGGIFHFAVPSSVGGPLLQQLQLLPPGSYRLTGHSIGIDQADNARPYWALTCRDGRELGRFVLPNSDQANGEFFSVFSVPADCPVQTLVLVARPSDAVSGVSGQIDRVQLAPVGR